MRLSNSRPFPLERPDDGHEQCHNTAAEHDQVEPYVGPRRLVGQSESDSINGVVGGDEGMKGARRG